MGRPEIAANAVNVAERRLASNKWPEYYDTKNLRFIGKQARLFKIWSIAGYVPSKTTSKRQAPITPSIVNKASVALVVVLVTATTVRICFNCSNRIDILSHPGWQGYTYPPLETKEVTSL
ncbi:alkaline/neutral invertase E, chloroplastic-like protein [Tanacetum coccineum]|uniref:Alkaline/neutral invertase E, chloroplastic-like protein n=1 Tax=Tanacetum coccineum TaxID=301880 RepID=A0ABQ5G5C0_9ASTR